ncbi:hypothetical protein [Methylobacterium nodulans]|uniref:Uncharacterized protein n=1 Tax=Methylobacterium nodulans (strain LMG 21967 / CNCM I-2342 / ORS 2060) TaxID=460265 RepID=B8IIS3_METNO|nr:hypothetical protein [Methylobacterium nodulans]ACL59950.1 hypothetical protein Mnod_5104 [Methylobacterium nodulans ORS 2060]
MSADRLTFVELLAIGAAAFELLVAIVWRMPAAVVADIAGFFGPGPAFSFVGA